MCYRFLFDIDVKGREAIFATYDKQSVITGTTCIQKLKVLINAKGGDWWNYDRFYDHIETNQIVM